ncbi:MAG: DoxX family protein [Thermoplasmatota archaeon]
MVSLLTWILSGVLAAAFLMAGSMKAFRIEKMAEQMDWVDNFGRDKARMLGFAEMLGALGLILPIALGVAPILSGVAAACLMLLMLGAVLKHFQWDDKKNAVAPAILGLLSGFLAATHFA